MVGHHGSHVHGLGSVPDLQCPTFSRSIPEYKYKNSLYYLSLMASDGEDSRGFWLRVETSKPAPSPGSEHTGHSSTQYTHPLQNNFISKSQFALCQMEKPLNMTALQSNHNAIKLNCLLNTSSTAMIIIIL